MAQSFLTTILARTSACSAAALLSLGLAACHSDNANDQAQSQATPAATQNAPAGMANPASVFCGKKGGQVVMVQSGQGTVGMCHLPDGQVVDEWTYFRAHAQEAAQMEAAQPAQKSAGLN
ncbi:DUF333 domain-containing protein [Formicincola oecophyllae]|uniref:DUF333 domain-containing protein n=1 Tax=Formicincola oecophyllae TaxID=2558361 RepID=A0A4Y6U6A9_9PROT|nr:DUF333 domain-containing protein [Formicincola oecophyllae]QDH12872.1 DUF333 domain-containing protein [Formicincola oecophyllae]